MAAVIAHAHCAAAATGATAPPEIVVTAPGGGDVLNLSDSPVNAQVLSGERLTRGHPASLADLLNADLGSVSLSNGTGSPWQNDLSYRGFQATSLPGSATGLSVWIDGVRMNEAFGATVNWDLIPMNALATVAVLPGANPLFGLNTLGGSLVLTTKNGAEHGGAVITVQGGSFKRRAGLAEAGGTWADRTLDWFVSGNYDDQNGYRWYSHTRVSQAFGKLRWHGAVSQAELGLIWADTALHGTQALPLAMLATPQVAYTWPDAVANRQVVVNLRGETRAAPGLKISGNLYFRRSDSRSSNSNASLGDDCDGVTYDCRALAPGGTARDLFVSDSFVNGAFTAYTGSLPIHDYTSGINTSLIFSGVAQHTWGGTALIDRDTTFAGLRHDINLGGSAEISDIGFNQNTDMAYLVNYQTVVMPQNLLYAGVGGFSGDPTINRVALSSHGTSVNLFARDAVRLTARLSLTASIAYTTTRLTLSGSNTTLLGPDGSAIWTGDDGHRYTNPGYSGAATWNAATATLTTVAAPAGSLTGPQIEPVAGAHRYARLNPAVGLVWQVRPGVGLFADASQAMRAPTAIELACADPARPCALPTGFNGDPAIGAVVAHSIEAGLRGTIGRHMAFNAAVYRTVVDNDIQFVYGASGLGYFANLGQTARRGVELALSADLARVHLSASYGAVAATFRTGFVDASGDRVAPGSHIPGIPAQSLKLRGSIQPAPAVQLGASVVAVSGQYAHGDEANRGAAVPGYALVNGDLAVALLAHIDVFATLTNAFDVRYATFAVTGSDVYTGTGTQFRTPAPGRTLLAGLRWRFGARRSAAGSD